MEMFVIHDRNLPDKFVMSGYDGYSVFLPEHGSLATIQQISQLFGLYLGWMLPEAVYFVQTESEVFSGEISNQ